MLTGILKVEMAQGVTLLFNLTRTGLDGSGLTKPLLLT